MSSEFFNVLSNGRLFYTVDSLTVCVFYVEKIRVNMQRRTKKKVVKNLRNKKGAEVCCRASPKNSSTDVVSFPKNFSADVLVLVSLSSMLLFCLFCVRCFPFYTSSKVQFI